MSEARAFLFLQGPPGPFFRLLATEMESRGIAVRRINLSGGDRLDWPQGGFDYLDEFAEWPAFFDRFINNHSITDLLLFGDCRPYHVSAHGVAAKRGVRTHVLEEGYLRPDWMTLELEGVNARSTLSRDKHWFVAQAKQLPPEDPLPPVTASFRRRSRDSYWYYHNVVTGRWRFRNYRSHRSGSLVMEGLGWLWKFMRAASRSRAAEVVIERLHNKAMFVLPLQLSGDYQIRTHSSFADMQSAAAYAISSFATHAPSDTHLLLKAHPLDCSFFNWPRFVDQHAERHDLVGRLHFVDGGNLDRMAGDARGLVCVNSTSATIALEQGTPVCTLGEAIYDIDGLTHQQHLDTFWANPSPIEPGLYSAFRRVLVDRCMVRGGLASESAVATLVYNTADRLCAAPADHSDANHKSIRAK